MTTTSEYSHWIDDLVDRILDQRLDPGFRSVMAKGSHASTETQAYPLFHFRQGVSRAHSHDWKVGVVRAGAIIATTKCPDVSGQQHRLGFGSSMRTLAIARDENKKDGYSGSVTSRMRQLSDCSVEQAAEIIRSLMTMASEKAVAVDHRNLMWTLAHWGRGNSRDQVRRRSQLLLDFYTEPARTSTEASEH